MKSDIACRVNGQEKTPSVVCMQSIPFHLRTILNKTLTAVRASCPRPPTVQGGFFISRGVVNHVYVSGSTVKYYCDTGHQPKGPSVLTCSGKEWLPRDLPACLPLESSNGKFLFGIVPLDGVILSSFEIT